MYKKKLDNLSDWNYSPPTPPPPPPKQKNTQKTKKPKKKPFNNLGSNYYKGLVS